MWGLGVGVPRADLLKRMKLVLIRVRDTFRSWNANPFSCSGQRNSWGCRKGLEGEGGNGVTFSMWCGFSRSRRFLPKIFRLADVKNPGIGLVWF